MAAGSSAPPGERSGTRCRQAIRCRIASTDADSALRRENSELYAVLLARGMVLANNIKYARTFEHFKPEETKCSRDISAMIRLPSLADFGLSNPFNTSSRQYFPLVLMRKGQMYTNLSVSTVVATRVVSNRTATRLTHMMLYFEWLRFWSVVREHNTDHSAWIASLAGRLTHAAVAGTPRDSRLAATRLERLTELLLRRSFGPTLSEHEHHRPLYIYGRV